jgi:mRNA interferase RelE/StbE
VANYTLTIARQASRDLETLPASIVQRLDVKILALARDPRPPGTKKLKGARDLWRLREGVYRIIYSIDDKSRVVDIIGVLHRSKAYK